jgi:excisionase family DNA binding protein
MPQFLTTSELAERLRCSVEHVRHLARTKRLPSTRLAPTGKLLFDLEAVEAALRQTNTQRPDLAASVEARP